MDKEKIEDTVEISEVEKMGSVVDKVMEEEKNILIDEVVNIEVDKAVEEEKEISEKLDEEIKDENRVTIFGSSREVNELHDEIALLKKQLREKEIEYIKEFTEYKFNIELEKLISKYDVINRKALMPFLEDFLEIENIEFEEDGRIKGLEECIKSLVSNSETSFLFRHKEEIKLPLFVGVTPNESVIRSGEKVVDVSKMSYTEMSRYLAENPNVTLN